MTTSGTPSHCLESRLVEGEETLPVTLAHVLDRSLQGSLRSSHWLVPTIQAVISACKPKQQTKVPEEASQPAALWFDSVNNPLLVVYL